MSVVCVKKNTRNPGVLTQVPDKSYIEKENTIIESYRESSSNVVGFQCKDRCTFGNKFSSWNFIREMLSGVKFLSRLTHFEAKIELGLGTVSRVKMLDCVIGREKRRGI